MTRGQSRRDRTESEGHDVDLEDLLDADAADGGAVAREHAHGDLPVDGHVAVQLGRHDHLQRPSIRFLFKIIHCGLTLLTHTHTHTTGSGSAV